MTYDTWDYHANHLQYEERIQQFFNLVTIDWGLVWFIVYINRFMVFNATFNNISVISWRSDLLVEETGVPEQTTDLL
jgi:hypothetical protein